MRTKMIRVTIEGQEHSGKGHLIALMANILRDNGIKVTVQGEQSHLVDKFEEPNSAHFDRLFGEEVFIMEQKVKN